MKIIKLYQLKTRIKRKNKFLSYKDFLKSCNIEEYDNAGLMSSIKSIKGVGFDINGISVTLFYNNLKLNEISIGANYIQILVAPDYFNLQYIKLVLEIIKHSSIERLLNYKF